MSPPGTYENNWDVLEGMDVMVGVQIKRFKHPSTTNSKSAKEVWITGRICWRRLLLVNLSRELSAFWGGPKPYQTWYPGSHIKIVGCCDMYLPFHLWDHHRYLAPICVPNLTILHPFQEMHFSHFEISVQEWAIPAIPATTQSLLIMYVKISANWERQAMCQDHAQSFQVKSPLVEEKIPTFHAEKSCPWMVNSNFMRLLAKFQEEFREDTAHAKAGATLSTSASMVHILDADVWIEISTYLP